MTHSDTASASEDFAQSADTDKNLPQKNLPAAAKMLVANARNDITIPNFTGVLQPVDDTLVKRGGIKGLAIYDEIERDTHAAAVLEKRKKNLVAREWEVKPGGTDQIDLDAAEFVTEQLEALPFDLICENLLDATLKGYAVSEVVWGRKNNRIVPVQIKTHDQRRFVFDLDWKPRLLTVENMQDGIALFDRKFIVHRHGVKGNNAYGLGIGTRLFWAVLFKREGVAFWMTFLDKFAAPTVIAKTPFGLGNGEEDKLLNSIANMVTAGAIRVPVGTEVSLLEASRAGSASYKEWCAYWDSQMSITTLGETLTTDIQGNGSRAAGEVHADILQMLVDADADLLSVTLRETLIQWMVDYNFPGAAVPNVWRVRAANELANAKTLTAKATASIENNKALRAVVATASLFADDEAARQYIQTMAPDDLGADMIDTLMKSRTAFAASEQKQPKKKALKSSQPSAGKNRSDTTSFADASDQDIQTQLVSHLQDFGADWDQRRLDDLFDVLTKADTLEGAAKAALKLYTTWKVDAFAATIKLALNASAYAGRDAVMVEMADDASFASLNVFSKPFKEQIDFLSQKSPRPTSTWTDIMHGDHDRSFVIAGAKDLAMLEDFQNAIQKAIHDGTGLRAFRKDFELIVAKYGWSFNGARSWRTRVIFETNVRTSYMAGRLKQMRDPDVLKARPFWQYRHAQTRKPKSARPQHLAWDGLILAADDPFWDNHFPPNDWGCSCGVRTLSARDLKRLGKSGPDESPSGNDDGIGRGFEYQPGDLWERGLVPSQMDRLAAKSAFTVDQANPIADLVASGHKFKATEMKSGLSVETYIDAFLKPFGAKRGAAVLFADKAGGVVPISDELFRDARGEYKVMKRGREVHSARLAETIADPDEIWVGVASVKIPAHQGGGTELVLDRKYIRVDPKTGFLAIFELLKGRWVAKTAFRPARGNSIRTDVSQIDKRRSGVLVYKRE